MPTGALAFALHRVLCAGLLLTRRHSNSARPAAARRPQRPRCIGAVVCVRRGQNRALECGPGRQRRVHISEGGQPASSPPPPVVAVLPNVLNFRSRTGSAFAVKSAFSVRQACILKTSQLHFSVFFIASALAAFSICLNSRPEYQILPSINKKHDAKRLIAWGVCVVAKAWPRRRQACAHTSYCCVTAVISQRRRRAAKRGTFDPTPSTDYGLHTLCPAATTSPHHGKKPKGLKCSTSRFFHTYP